MLLNRIKFIHKFGPRGFAGSAQPHGSVSFKVIRAQVGPGLAWHVRNRLRPGYWLGYIAVFLAKAFSALTGIPTLTSALSLTKIDALTGQLINYGVVGVRVVTTAGVNFLVDALQGTVEPEILKFHGIGTTNTAEAIGDTALAAELTTVYNPDNTRATGSLTEGASANIFRTVGTNTVDGTAAIVEHGIFSQAATGGGTLLDRTIFSTINLGSGDSLQSTYDLTVNSGG